MSYRLPVIVVIYEPEERIAYWHYIQDYFIGNDEVPNAESVPIRISKTDVFNILAKDRLAEIAAYPDSTAHAMLALRASRYREKQELLTSIELIELYGKRKWLGEWLPLDREREQILLHSSIAKRDQPGIGFAQIQIDPSYLILKVRSNILIIFYEQKLP